MEGVLNVGKEGIKFLLFWKELSTISYYFERPHTFSVEMNLTKVRTPKEKGINKRTEADSQRGG